MAKTTTIAAVLTVTAAMILAAFPLGTSAQSPAAAPGPSEVAAAPLPFEVAPAPALDCFPYLLNMSDCLTYVEVGSNLKKPEKGCCPELADLVATQPICLCELLANPDQAPVALDLPRALGLPSVCKVDAPASACAVLGIPFAAPVPAPASGPSASGISPGNLSPEGIASSPASLNNDNGGQRSTTASQRHFLVGLAILLFVIFF